MRLKFLLTSTACAALVGLVASSYSPSAFAANGRAIHSPASSWSVSHVRDKKGQGNNYCAMAQRFSRDVILTFAKNLNNESSLALDFQKPVLGRKRQVAVTLDPGSGIQRFYDVNPVMSKAFVVRMGQDDEFFTALNRTGFLRVEVEGKSYSFNMSDIEDGQLKLNTCLVSNVMPAAGDEDMSAEASAPVVAASSGDGAYRQEINELRKQLADIRDENTRLSGIIEQGAPVAPVPQIERAEPDGVDIAEMDALSDRVAELEEVNGVLKQRTEDAQKKEGDLQVEIEALMTSNKRISAQLEALQSNDLTTIRPKKQQDEALAVQKELDALKAENEALKTSIEENKAQIELSGEMEQQLRKLEEEKSELEKQIADVGQGGNAELDAKLKVFEDENKDLKAALANVEGSGAEVVSDLQGKIKALEAENTVLKDAAEEAETLEAQVKDVKAVESISQAQMEELQQTISELQDDIAKKDRDLIGLAEQSVEIEGLKTKNAELQARVSQARSVAAAPRKAVSDKKYAALNAKVKALEVDNQRLVGNLKAVMKSADVSDAANEDISGFISKLKAENQRLSNALEKKVLENNEIEIDALREKSEEFKAQNVALKAELDELNAKVNDYDAIAARNEAVESDLSALQVKLDGYEVAALENEKALRAAELEKEALLQDVEEKNAAITQAQNALDLVRAENEELKLNLVDLNQATQTVSELLSELEAIQKENGDLKIQVSELQQNLSEKESQSADASKRVEELKSKNSQLESQLSSIMKQVQSKRAQREASAVVARPIAAVTSAARAVPAEVVVVPSQEPARTVVDVVETVISDPVEANNVAAAQQNVVQPKEILDGASYRPKPKAAVKTKAPSAVVAKVEKAVDTVEAVKHAAPSVAEKADAVASVVQKEEAPVIEEVQDIPDVAKERVQKAAEAAVPQYLPESGASQAQQYEQALARSLGTASHDVEPLQSEDLREPVITAAEDVPIVRPAIGDVLQSANLIRSSDDIDVVDNAGKRVYQWRVNPGGDTKIYGSAELEDIGAAGFETHVRSYLQKTEERCSGDFAIIPDRSVQQNAQRIDSYEVACVGQAVSSAASIVFFNEGGVFTALAHEAPASDMDLAMDARDRVFKAITGS